LFLGRMRWQAHFMPWGVPIAEYSPPAWMGAVSRKEVGGLRVGGKAAPVRGAGKRACLRGRRAGSLGTPRLSGWVAPGHQDIFLARAGVTEKTPTGLGGWGAVAPVLPIPVGGLPPGPLGRIPRSGPGGERQCTRWVAVTVSPSEAAPTGTALAPDSDVITDRERLVATAVKTR